VVEGNRRTDAQAIREHFHASSDALVTPAAIDAALKELYETGLFEDVKIVRSGTHLIATVVEAPLIERLRFEGNKQIKDKDLAKEITLKPRGAMTKAAVREDVARIIEIYHRNGRYQVEVTPNTIGRGEGRVDLVFEIREGAKTGVKRSGCPRRREISLDEASPVKAHRETRTGYPHGDQKGRCIHGGEIGAEERRCSPAPLTIRSHVPGEPNCVGVRRARVAQSQREKQE